MDLFLRRLLLRSTLSETEQAAIRGLPRREATVEAGRVIVRPGEKTDHACMVVEGLVSQFDMLLDGRRQTVALYIPGEMCDLQSVPVPLPGWEIEALSPSKVLFVPHDALRKLIEDPNLALARYRGRRVDHGEMGRQPRAQELPAAGRAFVLRDRGTHGAGRARHAHRVRAADDAGATGRCRGPHLGSSQPHAERAGRPGRDVRAQDGADRRLERAGGDGRVRSGLPAAPAGHGHLKPNARRRIIVTCRNISSTCSTTSRCATSTDSSSPASTKRWPKRARPRP